MAKKSNKNKKINTRGSSFDIKDITTRALFLILGAISFFAELDSKMGYFINEKILKTLFGLYYQIIFIPVILILGIFILVKRDFKFNTTRFLGLILYFLSLNTLLGALKNSDYGYQSIFNIYSFSKGLFGAKTTVIIMIVLFLFSLFLMFQINYTKLINNIYSKFKNSNFIQEGKYKINLSTNNDEIISDGVSENPLLKKELEKIEKMKKELEREIEKAKTIEAKPEPKQLNIDDMPKKIQILKKEKQSLDVLVDKPVKRLYAGDWKLPNINLLKDIGGSLDIDEDKLNRMGDTIVDKLSQFNIPVSIVSYQVGPTVIQFRLQPEKGVKLTKIVNLKKDLALALKAKSIRIQAPIPGAGVVGIEVPNDDRQIVGLRELINSKEFNGKKEIPIAVGKDVNGDLVIGDLAKMPHLLIAGQTGSGKSVGMNGFLISLLYNFSPDDLKMILIDPKFVELSIYNGIPHLLTPVVTDPLKASNSLKWVVAEMLRRYDLAKNAKVRNLKEFNEKMDKDKRLPYLVVVIDELADLMMSGDKKEVETSIARIAQMARAVGIHLIIATQRPSVDVITGLIKANIPSRIAFTVASGIDSRTVLDKMGAEDLLGKGDMLYFPTGTLEPVRVQGVLVDTEEVESIINEIKLTIDPSIVSETYDPEIVNGSSKFSGSVMENYSGDQEEDPELVEEAIKVITEAGKGSTSLIQRKLGLGYARARKILDILEELGVVGPPNGSKPREVYK